MGTWVWGFAGMAMLYGAAGTAIAILAMRLFGRRATMHFVPILFTTLVFVFLTQSPFPLPGHLDCPVPTATPQLRLFNFWPTFAAMFEQGASVGDWICNRLVAATVMNVVLCAVIGIALARHTRRLRMAAAYGLSLTLTVELTQLTGIWGLYPCAYRQFNVDDLILNLLGMIVGFMLKRLLPVKTDVAE